MVGWGNYKRNVDSRGNMLRDIREGDSRNQTCTPVLILVACLTDPTQPSPSKVPSKRYFWVKSVPEACQYIRFERKFAFCEPEFFFRVSLFGPEQKCDPNRRKKDSIVVSWAFSLTCFKLKWFLRVRDKNTNGGNVLSFFLLTRQCHIYGIKVRVSGVKRKSTINLIIAQWNNIVLLFLHIPQTGRMRLWSMIWG